MVDSAAVPASELDEQSKAILISLNFPRASMKREMMCRRLDILRQALRSTDIDNIQMALGDFLMEARSLHDVIKNEGDKADGFRAWWDARKASLEADPLLDWTHRARVGDFHQGIPSIEVTGWQIKGGFEYDPEQKSDTKNLAMRDGGMFWISGLGTAAERIDRARIKADGHSLAVKISGLSISEGAPRSVEDIPRLCEEVVRRNQELLHEVKLAFPSAALPGG